jgi:hypothetical protein
VNGWIAVDLDGTLAQYEGWQGAEHIGPPIPKMLERVKEWVAAGLDVRIFTARAWDNSGREDLSEVLSVIENWCLEHVGRVLPITNEKDYGMVELWDDRCIQIEHNTGRRMDEIVHLEAAQMLRHIASCAEEGVEFGYTIGDIYAMADELSGDPAPGEPA